MTKFALMISAALLVLTSACKTPRRASSVTGSTQELLVQLLNFQSVDQNNPNVQAELHRCQGNETIPGQFVEPTMVAFPIKGLKPGTVCEVRLLYPKAPKDTYLFLAEPNLLYIAPNVAISQTVTGKLQATAILSKKYNLKLSKSFKITADVEFPSDVSGSASLIDAQLACDPPVATVSSVTLQKGGIKGKFLFPAPIDPQVKTHLCKAVNVFVNGNWRFQGKVNNGDGRNIVPVPDDTIALDNSIVKLQPIAPPQAAGITVQTIDGGSCADNEIFDIRTRSCVPATTDDATP